MMAFWKKYNSWISSLLFAVLAGCLVMFVIMPLEKNIQVSADDIQMRMIDDGLGQARIAKIPDMEKAGAAFTENKNNLDIMLSSGNEVDFIKTLESLAQTTGNKIDLKIEDNQPAAVAVPGKKDPNDIKANLPYGNYLSFQINLEGKYGNALDFIHKLENMNYYVNIISLNMARNAAVSDSPAAADNSRPSLFSPSENLAPTTGAQPQNTVDLKSTLEAVVYLHK